MTFVFEDCREGETDGDKRSFKTKNGAVNYGARLFKAYGYLAANRVEGAYPNGKHVCAEWKKNGVVIGKVWT